MSQKPIYNPKIKLDDKNDCADVSVETLGKTSGHSNSMLLKVKTNCKNLNLGRFQHFFYPHIAHLTTFFDNQQILKIKYLNTL